MALVAAAAVSLAGAATTPPPNDAFASAQSLSGASGSAPGDTTSATRETGEPTIVANAGGHSVWFTWIPAATGTATFDTAGSAFDTTLAVYTGTAFSNLRKLVENDDVSATNTTSKVSFSATAGTTYRIQLDGYNGTSRPPWYGAYKLNWSGAVPPPPSGGPVNDNFANAIAVSGWAATVDGSNANATTESGEPLPSGTGYTSTVWYSWTPTKTGVAKMDMYGSAVWAMLAVYTGSTVSSLTQLAYDGGDTSRMWGAVTFNAVAGTTYRIQVNSTYPTGAVRLNVNPPPPANDNFASAQALTGETGGTVDGTTLRATAEPGEPAHWNYAMRSIWYSWTPSTGGPASFSATASQTQSALAIYTGSAVSGLSKIGAAYADAVAFNAVAGTTYWIALDSQWSGGGPVRLTWTRPAPRNDLFANATAIGGWSGDVDAPNWWATAEAGEPAHAGKVATRSVWYRWTAPGAGAVIFKTQNAAFDTVLAAYTGASVSALTLVASNDNDGANTTSRISFVAQAGATYAIAVDGVAGAQGAARLTWLPGAPSNDDFANATPISGTSGTINGSNVGTTIERGEVGQEGWYTPHHTAWFRWTPSTSGVVAFDTTGSTFDTFLVAYTGSSVDTVQAHASDGYPSALKDSKMTFAFTAGTTYSIQLGSDYPYEESTGDYVLSWNVISSAAPAPPANDMIANAQTLTAEVGRLTASNAGATKEPGEPNRDTGGASVWYRWVAPQDGVVKFSLPWSESGFTAEVTAFELTPSGTLLSAYDGGFQPPWARIDAVAGVTYLVRVDGFRGRTGFFALDWTREMPPPSNDDFSARELLTGDHGTVAATNLGATAEPLEPYHLWSSPTRSVWFRWTPPRTGTYTFAAPPAEIDGGIPGLAVYVGSSLGTLTRLAQGYRAVSFAAVAGQEYEIAADGGIFWTVSWGPTGPPNDLFANAQPVSGARGNASVSTVGGSREQGEPAQTGDATVWYAWTAPGSGPVVFDTYGSDFPAQLVVATGPSVDKLTLLASTSSASPTSVTFGAQGGGVYFVAVGGYAGATGNASLQWKMASVGATNDLFANAQPLSGSGGTATASNVGAGKEPGEPNHAGRPGGASVWFTWTAPTSGPMRFDTIGSLGCCWDTQLAVYTGSSVGALTQIAGNDDYGPTFNGRSLVSFNAIAGTTYRIAVDGWHQASDGSTSVQTGTFALHWGIRPANDDFERAQPITDLRGSITGDNTDATWQVAQSEPTHNDAYYGSAGQSVWYAWTPSVGGNATVKVSASWMPAFAVYTGSSVGSLTRVAMNNAFTTSASFLATAGTTYWIAVDAWHFGEGGAFTLTYADGAPDNDLFANATSEYLETNTSVTESTIGASKEAGEPNHGGYTGGASVWYSVTPDVDSWWHLSTDGSSFPTVIAVYDGTSLTALTPIVSGATGVDVALKKYGTYRIAIDGRDGSSGTLVFSWTRAAPTGTRPANDDFANATVMSGNSALSAPIAGATFEPGQPQYAYPDGVGDVWFRWTAPATGAYLVTATPNEGVGIFTGDSLATLQGLGGGNDARFTAYAGHEYRIEVTGPMQRTETQFDLRVAPDTAPANDLFANAVAISGWSGTVSGTTDKATLEEGEPAVYDRHSVWYRWTAPSAGIVTFGGQYTYQTSWSIDTAVFTGSSVSTLRLVDSGAQPRVAVAAGQVLYVAMAEWSPYRNNAFDLSWSQLPAGPANDALANAVPLDAYGTFVGYAADLVHASREAGEPLVSGYSAWYRWTAPATGPAIFDTLSSDDDVAVAVFSGPGLGQLTLADSGRHSPYDEHVKVDAVAGATYWIALSLPYPYKPDPENARLVLEYGQKPANDDFAAAQAISGATGTVAGRTLGATKELAEPAHSGNRGGASVWYRWTAPASGSVIFDTAGSDFDAMLGVYTGSAVTALTAVAFDDQAGQRWQARVAFDAVAGTTYQIAVDGYEGDMGRVQLGWHYGPANDAFASAEALLDRTGRVSGTSVGATKEAGEPGHAGVAGGASVWWTWTPAVNGDVSIDTAGSSFDTVLAVYTGGAVGSLFPVVANDDATAGQPTSAVHFLAQAGVTYRIAVDGKGGASGRLFLQWSQLGTPANDAFANATTLIGSTGRVHDNNEWATVESGEPSILGQPGGASVWFRWTSPVDAQVSFETVNSSWDSLLAVYTGSSLSTLSLVAANDDKAPPTDYWWRASKASFRATAGTTYWIQVDGKNGSYATYDLLWNPPPANDSFDSFGRTRAKSDTIRGGSWWATKEPGEPDHAGNAGGHSVWLAWEAPVTGTVTFSTSGSSFDTLLAAYSGYQVSNLQTVAANDDFGGAKTSSITFNVTASQTYEIALDGKNGAMGDYVLSWQMATSAPANDNFASAAVVSFANGISAWTGQGSSDTSLATREAGEPDTGGDGHSVWFKVTAPIAGNLEVRAGGNPKPAMAIFTGSSLATLTRVGGDKPISGDIYENVLDIVSVSAGATYFVSADATAFGGGDVYLSFRLEPAPANDLFANAQTLTGASGSATGNNTGAARERGELGWGSRTVWYRWTPSAGGRATIDWTGSWYGANMFVYTGVNVAALTQVGDRAGSTVTFRADPGTTYWIQLTGYYDDDEGWMAGNFQFTWSTLLGDYLSGPVAISGASGTYAGPTAGATKEDGEPRHGGSAPGHSVWFAWTAPSTGSFTFDTAGSSFDTVLEAYTGSTYATLASVASADDGPGGATQAKLTFSATAGTRYLIAADGYSGASGSLQLGWSAGGIVTDTSPPTVSLTAPAAGARVAGTTTLAADATDNVLVTQVDFLVRGAVVASDTTAPFSVSWNSATIADGPADVVARARDAAGNVASSSARSITVDNSPPETTIDSGPSGTVYVTTADFSFSSPEPGATFACSLDNGAYASCTSPVSYSGLGLGSHTFAVRATDAAGNVDATPATRTWTVQSAPPPPPTGPANDAFASAQALAGATGSATGDTTNATIESGEPKIVGNAGGRSVWFAWTPAASGSARIDTLGSAFDTTLAVYTGSALTGLTKLAENDDTSASVTQSTVTLSVTAGTTYRIQLDGYNGTSRPPWYGSYKLSWSGPAAGGGGTGGPANDNFVNAQSLPGATGTALADTTAATVEAGEPKIVGNAGGHSVWFAWTPAASGSATIDTVGSAFDTTLAVYTGSALTGLTKLAENDDASASVTQSTVTVAVTAGTTYRIQVDGFNGTSRPPWYGSLKLNWNGPTGGGGTPPPPANDAFAGAQTLSGATGSATGDTTNATREAGEPTIVGNAGGHSLWFVWTPAASGSATVDTIGSAFDTTLAVYTGASLTGLTKLAENDDASASVTQSTLTVAVTAGTTYRIQVDGYNGTSRPPWYGALKLNWSGPSAAPAATAPAPAAAPAPAPAPTNDAFAAAATLPAGGGTVTGDTTTATREAGEPTIGGNAGGHSVWFTWTPTANGTATVDPTGSGFTTLLAVYTGTSFSALTKLAEAVQGQLVFAVTAGTAYRIQLDGAGGAYKLTWNVTAPPPPATPATTTTTTATTTTAATATPTTTAPAPDATPPDTKIDSAPPATTTAATATFAFSSSETGSTFECALDALAWAGCTSGITYSSLAEGQHVFQARATDAAGNTDPTPASATWTVTK